MSDHSLNHWRWLNCGIIVSLTIAAFAANESGHLSSARLTLHDALSPGRFVILSMTSPLGETSDTGSPVAESTVADDTDTQSQQLRRLLIENAQLQNRIRILQQSTPAESLNSMSLVEFTHVPARILSHDGTGSYLTELLIDAGRQQELRRSELVLADRGTILDIGNQQGLVSGQTVVAGAVVAGRITKCGRWTSLVVPVTSPEFTSKVQLARTSDHETWLGPVGLLAGEGNFCRITGIPYTEPVTVGDDVFTADGETLNGPRLYFGKIVEAELKSGGEWSIRVEPAVRLQNLDRVAVLHGQLNREIIGTPTAEH